MNDTKIEIWPWRARLRANVESSVTTSMEAVDYEQSGVVPFRRAAGGMEVLLITSRRRRRWIVPKGFLEGHLSPAESAAAEAYQEAGVKGRVIEPPIGEYRYRKWGGVCRVRVFALRVDEVLDEWPESDIRRRMWMSIESASEAVKTEGLKAILRRTATQIGKHRGEA